MMGENVVVDKSFQFAVRIVRLYQFMCEQKKEYVLSKQLLRSGTSIGANVSEAQQAQSRPDFLSKMNIALKETGETDFLNDKQEESIMRDCEEIKKLLHSIVKTTSSSKRGNTGGS
jgi:four helix bundle protein